MATIGRPSPGKNPFSDLKIQKKAPIEKTGKDLADELNKIAGYEDKSKFVDAKKHNQLDKDGFLKLLSFQLQNQDPLKPMDQKKFAADLAQFSQLEQMSNMNKKLDNLGQNGPSESKFFGASFLGKKITTKGSTVNYSGEGSPSPFHFTLPKKAEKLMLRVFDSKNQMVAQIEREGLSPGGHQIHWDGKMLDNTRAVKDTYRFEVRAFDEFNDEFKGQTKAEGTVTGVHFEGKELVLVVDGKNKVFLRDVDSFSMPKVENNAHNQKIPTLKKSAAQAYNKMDENNIH
jgi:flagellar basal-body rod modification protein FlgD